MEGSAFMENLKQLFGECDVDNNGCLGREEFSELCAKIGLNKEAAHETFDRLDVDRDDKITFEEFAAGFNQYKSAAGQPNGSPSGPLASKPGPHSSENKLLARKPQSPVSTLGRKSASPIGVMSMGGGSTSRTSSSSNNLLGLSHTISSSGGGSADISDFNGGAAGSGSFETATSSASNSGSGFHVGGSSSAAAPNEHSEVVYSGEATGQDYYDQPAGSGQFGSLFGGGIGSNGGGGGNSLNGSLNGSFSQVRNMQDLLECVQKLQSENQILTQIFFKDKREREEYISQLGEEFDLQVREVEERANRRAREELENEKKRLREMMQTERETLQHHYKTIEKMSNFIQQGGGPQGSRSSNDLLLGGEGIDKVKSKLEDTYLENRQLKRSLLDTKTDVAMIWKEMEKLKSQYEDKLSNAYQKNNETSRECDHIKQQLSLMKDSNRKLQDASDVITTYITDKVEPVIKGASGAADDSMYLSPNGCHSLTGSLRLAGAAGTSSQSNSRRGSVLSEYLNSHPCSEDDDDDDDDDDDGDGDDEDNLGSGSRAHQSRRKSIRTKATGKLDKEDTAASSRSLSGGGGSQQLPRINLPPTGGERQAGEHPSGSNDGDRFGASASSNSLPAKDTAGGGASNQSGQPTGKPTESWPQTEDETKLQTSSSVSQSPEVSKTPAGRGNSLKALGRHFFLGSKDKLLAQESVKGEALVATKSVSLDQVDARLLEPLVEPADGPSVATFNIILVGDSFVGKSSFAARFMEGSFVQGLISNCSIDFKTKAYKVDGINYTVNLWDTAGQERFRSITASYFRKADGIILMYDVTDKRSYLNVRNWMSTISDTAAENVAVLLVGNKIDLRDDKNKDRCVPHSEGFRLAKEYDIVFLETSVKTGTNLVPSMGRLIRLIAKNNSPEEEDDDRIRLNDKSRSFQCMPKNC